MDLTRHIEILLIDNDCVTVPGLGSFMAQYIPARYDGIDGSFLPPMRTVGFIQRVVMNDSLVAQSYVEAYDISYPEAVRRLEDDVEAVRRQLEETGDYQMNGIGTLSLNADGNLEFEPAEAGIITPSLYGLGNFQMERIDAQSSTSDEHHVNWRMAASVGRYVAAAAIAVVAFLFIPSPSNDVSRQPARISQSAVLPSVLPSHINIAATHTKLTASPKPASAKVSKPKPQPSESKVVEQPKPFTIVLASRITHKNADAMVAQLQSEGMSGVRIHVGTANVKVVNGSFATRQEAVDSLNELVKDKRFADSWVMEIK